MLKWVGSLMIIGTMTIFGFVFAERYVSRCRILKVWLFILDHLKTEVYYHSRMLPEIFDKIASCIEDTNMSKSFQSLAKSVSFGSDTSVFAAWERLLRDSPSNKLHPHDFSILHELGSFIGSTDRQDQAQRIESCCERLRFNLEHAEKIRDQQVGVYRYLGFALGCMLVLVMM